MVLHVTVALRVLGDRAWIDFETYLLAYHRFTTGSSLYDPAQLAGPYRLDTVLLEGYAYPPPSVFLFGPFALPVVGHALFTLFNGGLLLLGMLSVIRHDRGKISPLAAMLVLWSLALSWPFAVGIASGNINVGLAGLLALAWVRPWQQHSAFAAAAAAAAIVKVVPGVLVVWGARAQGLRALLVACASGTALVVLALPFTGLTAWQDFATALSNSQPICDGSLRISIACITSPVVGAATGKLIGIGVGAAALIGVFMVPHRLLAYGLVALAWLAPISDFHEHTWLFVQVLVLVVVTAVLPAPSTATPRLPSVSRLRKG